MITYRRQDSQGREGKRYRKRCAIRDIEEESRVLPSGGCTVLLAFLEVRS